MEHDLSVKGVWMIKARPPCLECSLFQPERSHGRANSLQAAQLRKHNPNAFPLSLSIPLYSLLYIPKHLHSSQWKKHTITLRDFQDASLVSCSARKDHSGHLGSNFVCNINHKLTPIHSCESVVQHLTLHSLQSQ